MVELNGVCFGTEDRLLAGIAALGYGLFICGVVSRPVPVTDSGSQLSGTLDCAVFGQDKQYRRYLSSPTAGNAPISRFPRGCVGMRVDVTRHVAESLPQHTPN